ncbi:related to transcription factor PLM2 [Rhynchosporium agropyri]|uniref:Related to transcription factor PLM2 n=1 Tax=Rhynchosporium agropyri TaxID=914238 RepID=A0A1E1LCX1_9HELO|nr:related to transcription factor PLM2 [Rhynchosporium agropyri]
MESSPSKMNAQPSLPSTAGVKRPAPSLLPAFEPFSSSPGFPRPSKRQARSPPSGREHAYSKYPTPIPTSTTGILSSSPPRVHTRPNPQRTQSSVSERAPLSAVPSVILPENGEVLRMGRSSNSSHYQLSANRLISRVHVEARYISASVPLEPNKVEIKCKGWNGVKLHCQGRTWELARDDTFTSETEFAEIMLDVQDARVLIAWPGRDRNHSVGAQTDSSWDEESSPRGRASAVSAHGQMIASSPLRRGQRIASPVSPTPAGPSISSTNLADLFSDSPEPSEVKVYEDAPSPKERPEIVEGESFVSTQPATSFAVESQSSDLSEPENDPDEENDPVVHSFGPHGADISARMASFTAAGSPEQPRGRDFSSSPQVRSSSESTNEADSVPVVNHVVNQLAFSRLSSTPLSVILNHLPAELKGASSTYTENRGLSKDDLRKMLNAAACIGKIHREGKDAAGKALESEYYYIPDEDTDENRRAAVVDGLRKPSLRNCRKQHKQYYWKKPRTP